jgi:hypothetical protein
VGLGTECKYADAVAALEAYSPTICEYTLRVTFWRDALDLMVGLKDVRQIQLVIKYIPPFADAARFNTNLYSACYLVRPKIGLKIFRLYFMFLASPSIFDDEKYLRGGIRRSVA